jgi:type II secretory pathway component PulC
VKSSHVGKSAGLTVPMAIAAWCAMPVGSALAANDGAAAGVARLAAAPTPVTTELPPPRSGSSANTNTNTDNNADTNVNTDTNTRSRTDSNANVSTNTGTVTDSTVRADDSSAPSQMPDADRREQAQRSREVAAEVRAEAERERAEERARGAAARGAAAGERAAERARAVADHQADEAHAKVEARLRDAQARLQAAAEEVSRLSAEVSRSVMQNFNVTWSPHAVIGVVISHGDDPAGAHVAEVSPGGAAADAGLRAGDVIVSINGNPMGGPRAAEKVVEAVREVGTDRKLRMQIRRENKDQEIVVVARAPAGFGGATPFVFAAPPVPAAQAAPAAPPAPPAPGGPNVTYGPFAFSYGYGYHGLGNMELATLTPQLGHYFGTDKGVLVVRAPKDSDFKLQDGDVILSIDGREPISGTHATRILASYQPGEKVVLHIMRERKAMNVETKLPDSSQGMHRPARSAPQPEASS